MPHLQMLFVTGTRADWSKLKPLADAMATEFDVEFFVIGMHMLEEYGNTKEEVHKFSNATFYDFKNHQPGDNTTIIHSNTANQLQKLFDEYKLDLLIVHGDRVEAIAACMVAAHNGVRIAHIKGGEVSGSIDNSYRYACTHFSTSHFVCSDKAQHRLVLNGQHTDSIFNIGSPALDVHNHDSSITIQHVLQKYHIPFEEFGIVTFHPVTMERQARELFNNLDRSAKNFIVIMPNNDPGSDDICKVISRLDAARFYPIPNVEFLNFSILMKNCQAVIGNSSTTVRECPFLGIPSLNVGTQQHGRAENAASIMHTSSRNGYNFHTFFNTMWGQRFARHIGYGRGNAAGEFLEVLLREEFWALPLQKIYVNVQ